jgi:K+-transporting ATPase KdpF subunit
MCVAATGCKEPAMIDYLWTGGVSLLLLVYLLYALLKPERF